MPRVSVLMPTWNRAQYLGEAIQSVLCQTAGDLELIVIDDGSTDDTERVLADVHDERLRVIRREHGGISAATNAGLRAVRGEFIAHLDSDDIWLPDMLEVLLAAFDRRPAIGVAYARAVPMTSEGRLRAGAISRGFPPRFPDDAFRSMLYGDFTCNISVLCRKTCHDVVGEYDETLRVSEDWDMHLRLAGHFSFQFVDRVVAHYRHHPANTTVTHRDELVAQRARILDKVFAAPDLPAAALAHRAVSYRNVYTWVGQMYLAKGDRRRAALAFGRALATGADPLATLARLTWLTLSLDVLPRVPGGRTLVALAIQTRERLRR